MVDTIEMPAESGYETDFYAWTEAQAAALRAAAQAGGNLPVDWENLAEEIESLGRSDVRELRSRIATIIEHLLKLEFAPAAPPRADWADTIDRSRVAFETLIAESPGLRPRVAGWVEREHVGAARLVLLNLQRHGEWTPVVEARLRSRRYTEAEILGDWWPNAIVGPNYKV